MDANRMKMRKTRWGQTPAEGSEEVKAVLPTQTSFTTGGAVVSIPQVPRVSFDVAAAAAKAREALEKAKKAAMFQRQIHERLALFNVGGKLGKVPGLGINMLSQTPKPRPLRLDRFGRELDEDGRVIPLKPLVVPTLKVNVNREKEERLKHSISNVKSVPRPSSSKPSFFDSNIKPKKTKKGLRFVEAGFYISKEKQLLKKQEARYLGIDLQKIKQQRNSLELKDKRRFDKIEEIGQNIDDPNQVPLYGVNETQRAETSKREILKEDDTMEPYWSGRFRQTKTTKDPIPDIELWDMGLIIAKGPEPANPSAELAEDFPFVLDLKKITALIEHPVQIFPPAIGPPVVTPIYLTKDEQKRLRKRKKQEKERDKQDKIRMGLIPPPLPKIKLSNLMRSLATNQSVAESSTRAEKLAREQMAQRLKDHQNRNAARQLSVEERARKKSMKWQKLVGGKLYILVFWIKDMMDGRCVFKIDINAQQCHLSGVCVICPGIINGIVVEGSLKSIKKYKSMLMNRIKWEDFETLNGPAKGPESTPEEIKQIRIEACSLLWEGAVQERVFKNWKVHLVRTIGEARKVLSTKNADHYWDLIRKCRNPLEDIPKSTLLLKEPLNDPEEENNEANNEEANNEANNEEANNEEENNEDENNEENNEEANNEEENNEEENNEDENNEDVEMKEDKEDFEMKEDKEDFEMKEDKEDFEMKDDVC